MFASKQPIRFVMRRVGHTVWVALATMGVPTCHAYAQGEVPSHNNAPSSALVCAHDDHHRAAPRHKAMAQYDPAAQADSGGPIASQRSAPITAEPVSGDVSVATSLPIVNATDASGAGSGLDAQAPSAVPAMLTPEPSRSASANEQNGIASQAVASAADAPVLEPSVAVSEADVGTVAIIEQAKDVTEPLETVEQFAKKLLQERLRNEAVPPAAVSAAVVRPRNLGFVGPSNLELVYIVGHGDRARAYVRIDGRYTRTWEPGEYVAGWKLLTVGNDYVDVMQEDDQSRLYLSAGRTESNRAR